MTDKWEECDAPVGPLHFVVGETPGGALGTLRNSIGATIVFDRPVYDIQPFIEALRALPGVGPGADVIVSPRFYDRRSVRFSWSQDIPMDDIDLYEKALPAYYPRDRKFVYPDGVETDARLVPSDREQEKP